MPFGLKNAPVTYQQVIDTILTTVRWQFTLLYLDDIIVFSSSLDDPKSTCIQSLSFSRPQA